MESVYCQDANQAITLLEEAVDAKQPFQMAILDYLMPELNGEMLARNIRENDKVNDLALIMLTSAGGVGTMRSIKEAGFNTYLTKPIKANELKAVLSLTWQHYSTGKTDKLITSNNLMTLQRGNLQFRDLKFNNPAILLAEDNRVNQDLATEILEQAGCKIDVVINGKQAVDAMRNSSFDLVLMDCEMPVMSGFEIGRASCRERV